MKIIATLKDAEGRCTGRAVGLGANEAEAIESVLHSSKRFTDQARVFCLADAIREALSDPPSDALQADFDDHDWKVCIYW